MSKEFHIFKQNTDAIATNRGFYYQYLKTVKLWIDNFIDNEDNEIYCEREDDVFEYNPLAKTYKFHQIKCYSTASGLNSPEVKSSLLNFYMLYLKYDYQGLFYFESNTTIQPRAGKTLTKWIEQQKQKNFSVTDYLDEIRGIFRTYIKEKLDTYLKGKNEEKQDKAKQKADEFFQGLNEPSFEKFLESIRWIFSEEPDTNKAIANLSENILEIISEKLHYDNRVNKELLLGYLVNMVLEKSIEADEEKRLLTNALLKEALDKTEIDDTLFRSEIKDLLKANFFIPHALTEPFKREELFIGREKELKDMQKFLKNENSLLLVHSIGGMGKTTLIKEFLYREQNNYAHYGYLFAGEDIKQSWVNSGFRKSLSLVMEKIDDAFTESMVALQALEGKTLLVIDNIENVENQKEAIDKIMGLAQNLNFDIVMTSREIIEDISKPYELKSLSKEDAKKLFTSIYNVKDETLLEEVLNYLDWHTFFIEKVAQTLKNKKGLLTLADIKNKFDNQEFPDIRLKKKKNFNDLLTKLFNLDELEEDEVLLLKQLSVLPSIDIEFDFLSEIFQVKDTIEFQENLDYLNEKGWLIYADGSYKLHQIIKEFMLANYAPSFKDIENIVKYCLSGKEYEMKVLESIVSSCNQCYIKNKEVGKLYSLLGINYYNILYNRKKSKIYLDYAKELYMELEVEISPNIYYHLGIIDKKISYLRKALSQYEKENDEEGKALCLTGIGTIYWDRGLLDKALSYFKKELKILKDNNFIRLAINYNQQSLVYKDKQNIDKAFDYQEKAINLAKKAIEKDNSWFNKREKAQFINNLGELYMDKTEELDLALKYINQALNIREKILYATHERFGESYDNLAIIEDKRGNINKAYEYQLKAIEVWEESSPERDIYLEDAKKRLKALKVKLDKLPKSKI